MSDAPKTKNNNNIHMSNTPKTSNLVRKVEKKRRQHLLKHGDVNNANYLDLVKDVALAIKQEKEQQDRDDVRAEKSQRKEELSRITSDDILEESFQENALTNAANAAAKVAAKAAKDAAARKSARNTKKNQKKKQKQKQKKAAAARIRLMDMITTRIKILEAQKSQPLENIPLSAEFAMLDFKKLVMI